MDIRQITPRYHVAAQIGPEDFAALAEAGYTTVLDNRPDAEIPSELQSPQMQAAAQAVGVTLVINPLTMDTMTPDRLAMQRQALEGTEGKVLAYCRSGTRSTIAWALAHAGDLGADVIIGAAAQGGYDLAQLRPALEGAARG